MKLTDAETGREAEVTISGAECAAYRRRAEGWRRGLRAACLARGVGYLIAPTDVPVEAVVLGSLRRAGLLR